eukprot:CAMPEP_0203685182 /NCGR_PEP_ID=MMETSP0090-20130426/48415_1 /ASSEMBLY_ACC=CAM_ASM_001088 /TAXON_ID=426623 /ORGANISM="Chaetoceros affinis, Strain CCMP159" /LENGTH=666 /DNA_ID=CAMNT_0050554369 /DNA_START=92 /DNA_END=2093 /DNA_ORIENTATION=-
MNNLENTSTSCTNNTNITTAVVADNEAQGNLRQRLEDMIDGEDWDAITQMLLEGGHKEEEQDELDTTNNTTVAASAAADNKAQGNLRQQLEDAIDGEDWGAITQMLEGEHKEEEQEEQDELDTTNNTTVSRISHVDEEIFEAILSSISSDNDDPYLDDDLVIKLLQSRDNEEAKALLLLIIALGGQNFVMQRFEYVAHPRFPRRSETLLHIAWRYNASLDVVSKLVKVGGEALVRETNNQGWNSLHFACRYKASLDVVSLLIEVGGEVLVRETNNWGENSLHFACANNASIDVVSKLVEVGGEALVRKTTNNGSNSLHIACRYNASLDVVSLLIEVGGEALVRETDNQGDNSLHCACIGATLAVGGEALVRKTTNKGSNSLHIACRYNASLDVVSKLVEVGGEALVKETDNRGDNALHCACTGATWAYNNNMEEYALLHETFLNIITQQGGAQILTQTNNEGKTPLQLLFIAYDKQSHDWRWRQQERKKTFWKRLSDYAVMLIKKGIELQVGGEYGIVGLFTSTSSQEVQYQIYFKTWDNIVIPALEQIIASLPHDQTLPILQALVINKAPPVIIKSAINLFTASINTRDSFGKYPIDVAACHGLAWDDGMKEVVERSDMDLLGRENPSTGLSPFMVAGVGEENTTYDVGTVFHLIKRTPLQVARK